MNKDEVVRLRELALKFRDRKRNELPSPEGMLEIISLATTATELDVAVQIDDLVTIDDETRGKFEKALGVLLATGNWKPFEGFIEQESRGTELAPIVNAFRKNGRLCIVAVAFFLVWKDEFDRQHTDLEDSLGTGQQTDDADDTDGMSEPEKLLVATVRESGRGEEGDD